MKKDINKQKNKKIKFQNNKLGKIDMGTEFCLVSFKQKAKTEIPSLCLFGNTLHLTFVMFISKMKKISERKNTNER